MHVNPLQTVSMALSGAEAVLPGGGEGSYPGQVSTQSTQESAFTCDLQVLSDCLWLQTLTRPKRVVAWFKRLKTGA